MFEIVTIMASHVFTVKRTTSALSSPNRGNGIDTTLFNVGSISSMGDGMRALGLRITRVLHNIHGASTTTADFALMIVRAQCSP